MSNHKLIRLKNLYRANQLDCVISYFFHLHLMLHAYVRKFDVTVTVANFLPTERGLSLDHTTHAPSPDVAGILPAGTHMHEHDATHARTAHAADTHAGRRTESQKHTPP